MVSSAIDSLTARGHEVVSAVLVGGREKLPEGGVHAYGKVPVRTGPDPRVVLHHALIELHPDEVLDLSDEPVLDYRARHELAAVALYAGIPYAGADFRFTPPPRPQLCSAASIAVAGTGKRTGKTAVAGFVARALARAGRRPVVVAMGRGGPEEPEVLPGGDMALAPGDLLALADAGKHAASDYIEDAVLARVPTVGCRRCGGGLAGGVEISNVAQGIEVANSLGGDMMLLEGSGSALPPAHADATILVVPAAIPQEYIEGYFGPFRLLLADFVVVTMCEYPFGTPSQVSSLVRRIRAAYRPEASDRNPEELQVVRTVFLPTPIRPVAGASVFVATTAPEAAGNSIRRHLEAEHGCRVTGISHSLSDRSRLQEELDGIGQRAEVLLCEIKAAAIDVATRRALHEGLEVVYMDNIPHGIDGDDMVAGVDAVARLADERFAGAVTA